jgi:patatin-like phospholipase/acyl hydrolase
MRHLILSLDGGGIRGVLTAKLLERLEAACPFLDGVQLFAGTSTGGLLALGLARGLSPTDLVELYRQWGSVIFSDRDALDRLAGPADELWRADYDNQQGLRSALLPHFEGLRLRDLGHRVLIPTFDLCASLPSGQRQWKPKFLHNYDTPGNDGAVSVLDAALRTTAAPTYFPSYQGAIDGGVVVNNPSMCAVAKALKAGVPLEEIHVLSLGTGFSPRKIEGQRLDWGSSQWSTRIIQLMLEGMPGVADYQCAQVLGPRYLRLDVTLEEPIDLDDAERVADLIEIAEATSLAEAIAWLRRLPETDPVA